MSKLRRPRIAIIDFGMGNLFSVQKACEHVGLYSLITHQCSDVEEADGVILPGVGAFGDAMKNLKANNLVHTIKNFISSGRPFLGICLGMQLLMDESEEFGVHKGLGIIPGRVIRFPLHDLAWKRTKVPQVGWNKIFYSRKANMNQWGNTPLQYIENGEYTYFVHSYYVEPSDDAVILSKTVYGDTEYCSSLLWYNVFAAQFHPEKSAAAGLQIYKNWATKVIETSKK